MVSLTAAERLLEDRDTGRHQPWLTLKQVRELLTADHDSPPPRVNVKITQHSTNALKFANEPYLGDLTAQVKSLKR